LKCLCADCDIELELELSLMIKICYWCRREMAPNWSEDDWESDWIFQMEEEVDPCICKEDFVDVNCPSCF